MNTPCLNSILNRLEQFKASPVKLCYAGMQLRIENEKPIIFKTYDALVAAVKALDLTNTYSVHTVVNFDQFKSVQVCVSYLTEAEIGKPIALVKIARNINAFEASYSYIDQFSDWKFWHNLKGKLQRYLQKLSPNELQVVKELTDEEKLTQFITT